VPLISNLLSFNGCYGIAVYIYCHVILFKELLPCKCNDHDIVLVQTWLVIEVTGFYLSVVMSIVIFIMMCAQKTRKSSIRF
jgi:hypothetical protein